jgi:hypothetical protein
MSAYSHEDTEYKNAYLPALPEDTDMVSGKYMPQRIRTEDVDTVNILVRASDKTYGNGYDFQTDLITPSVHIRKIKLAKIGLPLIHQINNNNKTISVTHTDGSVTFDLVEGFYSVQGMVNMFQASFTTAWLSLDGTNLVTVSYDIDRRQITITDDNGEFFYIWSNCNFALYGKNVVKFPTLPSGSVVAVATISSTRLGMIYSRYIVLKSRRLTEDQKSFSLISGKGPSDIVAIIDLASAYNSSQFTVSTSFPGTDVIIETGDYAPKINFVNRNKALKVFDLQLEDEFGFGLNTLNTATFEFDYGVFMWFVGYL